MRTSTVLWLLWIVLILIIGVQLLSCKKQPIPDTYHQVDTVKIAVYEQTIKGMWQCYDGVADTLLIDKDNMTFWYIWYSKNVCRYASCSDTIYFYTGDKVFPEYNYILSNDTLILSFGSIFSRDSMCFKRI